MSQLMVELIGSGYGVIMVATHAFVDRTWLKWSLIAIEAIERSEKHDRSIT